MNVDFSNYEYTPVLKWKQGEYQALLRLSDEAKSAVLPLIDIPPIGWDFEKQQQGRQRNQLMSGFVLAAIGVFR